MAADCVQQLTQNMHGSHETQDQCEWVESRLMPLPPG